MLNGSCEGGRLVNVDFGQLADQSGDGDGGDRLTGRDHAEDRARQVELEVCSSGLDDVKVVADPEGEVAAVGGDEADGPEDGGERPREEEKGDAQKSQDVVVGVDICNRK